MAAGVGYARRLGGVRHCFFIGNGQRVDFGPDGSSGVIWIDDEVSDHASRRDTAVRDGQGVQMGLDAVRGLVFLKAQLRILVELPPQQDDFRQQRVDFSFNLSH